MAAVSSTFKDPSVNFVWWIEGDKIDIDNTLQPALILYVKAKALMDEAARTNNAELAQIKLQSAQMAMAEYREMVRRYGVRRRDKTGGTRGIVPANFT